MAAQGEWLCKVLIRDTSKALLQGELQMMGEILGDSSLKVGDGNAQKGANS